jgi:D-ribose pyranose/furanose isomerase RbsD
MSDLNSLTDAQLEEIILANGTNQEDRRAALTLLVQRKDAAYEKKIIAIRYEYFQKEREAIKKCIKPCKYTEYNYRLLQDM